MSTSNDRDLKGGTGTVPPPGNGLFSKQQLAQARAKPQKGAKMKEQQKLSSLQLLRQQLAQATAAAKQVKQEVDVAHDFSEDPENVRAFVELIVQVDELVLSKILTIPGKSQQEAEQELQALSLGEKVDFMRDWASENSAIELLINALSGFVTNQALSATLSRVVERFELPLRCVSTMEELGEFFADAEKEGLAVRTNATTGSEEEIVVHHIGQRSQTYLPKREEKLARMGWIFCKDAEERAKANWDKMAGLRKKATPGLTPYGISKGNAGKLFLLLEPNKAVLLEAIVQGGWTSIQCLESVGLEGAEIPDDQLQQWDDYRSRLKAVKSDAWAVIDEALYLLNQSHLRAAHARKQSSEAELEPIMRVATLSGHPRDQELTHMLQGKIGTIPIRNYKFRWGRGDSERQDLFAIALERREDGKFVLVEVVSKFPFFRDLVGGEVPLEIDVDNLDVRLPMLPPMKSGEYQSLKMIERIVQLHLRQEKRVFNNDDNGGRDEASSQETQV